MSVCLLCSKWTISKLGNDSTHFGHKRIVWWIGPSSSPFPSGCQSYSKLILIYKYSSLSQTVSWSCWSKRSQSPKEELSYFLVKIVLTHVDVGNIGHGYFDDVFHATGDMIAVCINWQEPKYIYCSLMHGIFERCNTPYASISFYRSPNVSKAGSLVFDNHLQPRFPILFLSMIDDHVLIPRLVRLDQLACTITMM
jgi:hypothetical protein